MLVTIKERTQEIGIRRAIGAPPGAILSQILSESFVLTFIAGVLGLTAAVGLLSVADSAYHQAVVVAQEGADVSWQAPPCWRWPSSAPAVCWPASFRPSGH